MFLCFIYQYEFHFTITHAFQIKTLCFIFWTFLNKFGQLTVRFWSNHIQFSRLLVCCLFRSSLNWRGTRRNSWVKIELFFIIYSKIIYGLVIKFILRWLSKTNEEKCIEIQNVRLQLHFLVFVSGKNRFSKGQISRK